MKSCVAKIVCTVQVPLLLGQGGLYLVQLPELTKLPQWNHGCELGKLLEWFSLCLFPEIVANLLFSKLLGRQPDVHMYNFSFRLNK